MIHAWKTAKKRVKRDASSPSRQRNIETDPAHRLVGFKSSSMTSESRLWKNDMDACTE